MRQYLALVEETTRGTDPGSGYKFLPLRSSLQPKFAPKDESRKEFRGADTALGDSTVRRLSSAWSMSPECNAYPGIETGLLLKHLLGFAGTRSVVDTDGYEGILYPLAMPYGTGAELADKALGFIPNTDEEVDTLSQYWGGARIRSMTLSAKPGDDISLAFEVGGAGAWVGDPGQAETGSDVYPAAAPFLFHQLKCYIGSGISRTGIAPDFTAIAPGTMAQFFPDDLTLKITSGLDDKEVLNGVDGPSVTTRTGQFMAELDFTVDYRDPSSGFSSADEFNALFAGPRTNSLLLVLESSELAGAATAKYKWVIDLPLMMLTTDGPERNSEGKTAPLKLNYKSLYSAITEYPLAILTTDKAAAY